MTTTTLPNRYQINGLVDTSQSVLANMEEIATTAGSLISFDAAQGLWDVVILKTESTTRTFTDSDIIGGIQISGAGLTELYNSVMVEFALRDTANEIDFVRVAIAEEDRNPNEPDNELVIRLGLCNEPVQAEIIALQELKQNRLDRVVQFTVDWTAGDLNPGNVIGITNTAYGWSSELFRVITIERSDEDAITYSITAQQYDPNVYSTADLERYVRSDRNGIKTIGAIGTPNTPVIYPFQLDRRPGIQVEAVVPSGVVETMELWLSTDSTNYLLVETQESVGGGNFNPGDTVLFDFDQVEASNYYVKVRGMNSVTTGPFSAVDSYLSFVPQQVADNIQQDAQLMDNSGNLITAFLLSELAAWAFARSPSIGNILSDLGLGGNTITTGTGASASVITEPTAFSFTAGNTTTSLNNMAGNVTIYTSPGNVATRGYDQTTIQNNQMNTYADYTYGGSLLQITVQTPACTYDYDFLDYAGNIRTKTGFVAQPAMGIEIKYGNTYSTATLLDSATIDWNNNKNVFNIDNPSPGRYWVGAFILPTYDLDMYWPRSVTSGGAVAFDNHIFPYNFNVISTDGLKSSFVLYQ